MKQGFKVAKIQSSYISAIYLAENIHRFKYTAPQSKSVFEKHFYKLMNNAVFGKMEQIRKPVHIRICTFARKMEKLISKSNFKERTIFDEDMVTVHMKKTSIVFKKPVTIGMCL